MKSVFSFTLPELKILFKQQGEQEFRANQLADWIYRKGVLQWEEMSNLSLSLREILSRELSLKSLELVKMTESSDLETFKFLWKLSSGELIESVLICSGARRTVCISTQVGCPARCAFCASGRQGFFRNLAAEEIVEQVLHIHAWLVQKGERVSHVVYMGMGEPLENYTAVVRSIRLLCDPDLLHLSARRITVSTVGVVEGIQKLAQEDLKVNLVLSLHAPNQHLRKKLIPYARKYALEEIMNAMDGYAAATKRDITYEYILLEGINDQPNHAHELADLLRGKQCTVNLIPYNPVKGLKLGRPEHSAIKEFRDVLFKRNIVNTCRYTKGDDIAAACGQLALQESLEIA